MAKLSEASLCSWAKKISVRQSKQEVAPELFVKLIKQSILVLR